MSIAKSVLVVALCLGAPSIFANSDDQSTEHESASGHEGEHDFHRNFAGVFVGITGEDRRDKGFTLRVDYARYFTPNFAIGAIVEHAFGDLDFWVIAVPFIYRTGPWRFYVAPGIEDSDLSIDGEFLVRVGAEYAFEVGSWEIAPQVDVDFVDGDTVGVFGVVIGKGFC